MKGKYLVTIDIYDETEEKHIEKRKKIFSEKLVEKYTKYFLEDMEDMVIEEFPRKHKYRFDVMKEQIVQ